MGGRRPTPSAATAGRRGASVVAGCGRVVERRQNALTMNIRARWIAIAVTAAGLAPLPAWPSAAGTTTVAEQRHPDVLGVKVQARGVDRFDFDVTVSSPYDTAQRYADAFRVSDNSGRVSGERKLLHDHADEQPFTRDLQGVAIPPGVRSVVVQARDQKNGYGGKTAVVVLPGR
jgi:hypothetical protein